MAFTALLIPILLSTVLVFIASSVIHMVLQMHNGDYRKLPNEDEVTSAIRAGSPPPAQYIFPHCLDPKEAQSEEMKRKFDEGPIGVMWLKPTGPMQLGPFLMKWIAYTAVLSAVVAYLAWSVLPAGAPYLHVFRVAGTAAWLGYAWAGPADSIWKGKPWAITFRGFFDGLVYACLTAGTFAWLWPGA